ncbi:MAG: 3-phosphoshikimate 1-carboxyvinyltransferase [Opitutales bacterium]|nr:3-phosphoshikimate 1-carboxyvinyltransferase [Opitutales bacterium]
MSKPEAPVEVLPIRPFTKPANARVRVPGSKSITNRALAIGALCRDGIELWYGLQSRDTQIMQSCLIALGREFGRRQIEGNIDATTEEDYKTFVESGNKLELKQPSGSDIFPNHKGVTLHMGNAGTAARFMTALLCLQPEGEFYVDGDEAMYRRPMKGLTDALESLGAQFTFHNTPGCIPFTLKTAPITASGVDVDASESSQILSALLIMAAGLGRLFEVRLLGKTVSEPFVEMTAQMLRQFGARCVKDDNNVFRVCGPVYWPFHHGFYSVEPDATAASYFLAIPLAAEGTSAVEMLDYCKLQGDKAFVDVLERLGIAMTVEEDPNWPQGPKGIRATLPSGVTPRGVTADFEAFSDTFLTLAALTPLLDGKTRISGIAHTRKQETDRVAAMARELKKLGQHVVEEEGALEVTPDLAAMKALALKAREDAANGSGNASGCIEIDTYHDHRFAMSFAILGCRDLLGDGQPWLAIRDPKCCGKTFPDFFEVLEDAWKQSHLKGHRDACSGRFIADE